MKRKLATQGNLAVGSLAALVLFGFVNYFGFKYHTTWDWTAASFYSLSERSTQVVRSLDHDVRIVSFLGDYGQAGSDAIPEISTLLDVLESENPSRVRLEVVDPLRDPLRAETLLREFDVSSRRGDPASLVIVEAGERRREVSLDEMVQLESVGAMGGSPRASALTAEGAIVSAILAVTRSEAPLVRFAVGHGERTIDDRRETGFSLLAESLRRDDVRVESWDALASTEVPGGTDVVIVAGPTQPWLEAESAALGDYLDAGGRVLLFIDPILAKSDSDALTRTGLDTLLGPWGIELREDIILDPTRAPAFMGPETFVATQTSGHPVTERMPGEPVIASLARSVGLAPDAEAAAAVLLETSIDGWGETDIASLRSGIELDAADNPGPLGVAVAAELKGDGKEPRGGRLAVVGDADLAANLLLDSASNRAFLINLTAWLLDEERSLGVPPKDRRLTRLLLTREETVTMGLLATVGVPLLAVAAGLLTWWRRRRR